MTSHAKLPFLLSLVALLGGLGLFIAPPAATAQDDIPALAVRDHELNQELAAQCAEIYAETIEKLERLEEQAEGGSIGRVKLEAIGAQYVGAQQLVRLGERLIVLGETAGVDYKLRGTALEARVRDVMGAYLTTPTGRTQQENSLPELERRAQTHVRQVAAMSRLAEDGKWEEAEEKLYEVLDHINELAVWQDRVPREQAFAPYREAKSAIDEAMRKLRDEQAAAQIEGDLAQITPDFAAFLESLAAAVEGFNAEGYTNYQGEQLAGPEVVSAWIDDCQELHLQVMQCIALQTALYGAGGDTAPAVAELERSYANTVEDAFQSLQRLIDADAEMLLPADAPAVHGQYVAAFAPLTGKVDEKVLLSLAPALDRLAGRSPEFQKEVTAYRLATSDYLRWCERIAEDEAARQIQETSRPFSTVCLPAVQMAEGKPGLLAENNATFQAITLLAPLPEVTARMQQELTGASMSFGPSVGLGSRGLTLVQFANRGMAGATLPAGWNAAIENLEIGLLADDSHPPLTLQAAGALASARRGDTHGLGASVTGIEVKGLTPFFATLSRGAAAITPLETTQGGAPTRDSVSQVVLRFLLDTQWARHRYFYVPAGA